MGRIEQTPDFPTDCLLNRLCNDFAIARRALEGKLHKLEVGQCTRAFQGSLGLQAA